MKKRFGAGWSTDVTTAAIVSASFDAQPSARYYVAGHAKYPGWFMVALCKVLPTYLFDKLTESAH